MATKKKVETTEELKRVPQPPVRKELVGECADSGSRVVHVAQNFYREVEGKIQVCGTSLDGLPDGNWVEEGAPPAKALSMLGKQ